MSFSDQFIKDYIEATGMEAWVAEGLLRELRVQRGMRKYPYRKLPVDQRPKFDDTEIDREMEFLKKVIHQLESDQEQTSEN
jgi:hypothetical protein